MKTGIIGYGYVGQAMGRLFPDAAIYDVATHPDPHALKGCNFILICVPTPMAPDGSCDVRHVEAAAHAAREFAPDALVCIKSAVPPGTTDRLNEEHNTDVFTVSPEYIGEGKNFTPYWDYPHPQDPTMHDFVIVGGPRAGEVLDVFQTVMATTARYMKCTAVEAELVKRVENAFFATKVTFCNEIAAIAHAYGVDYHVLRELWLLDPRVGRSHTAVFGGFGGKCLPKDISALISESGVPTPLLSAVQEANVLYSAKD